MCSSDLYMVTTKLTVGVLGVFLAFAPHCFYGWYEVHIHYLNISPTVDMNIAGLIMALEQSVVMGIAVGYFFVRALNESEERQQRAERFGLAGAPTRRAGVPASRTPEPAMTAAERQVAAERAASRQAA